MMAVIFEVWPAEGRKSDYLQLAAALRAEVEKIDGFISVERFESLYEEGKLLSLQFWRDEKAITQWRNHLQHRQAQALGRSELFPTTVCASPRSCATTARRTACRFPLPSNHREPAGARPAPSATAGRPQTTTTLTSRLPRVARE
jgi:heme-degrading monooxygenase HmoA